MSKSGLNAMSVAQDEGREFEFNEDEFKFLADLIVERTGIVLAKHKKDMVYSRLVRRVRSLRLKNFAEYCSIVQCDPDGDEIGHLVNAITTNLTNFFREKHHFDHLAQVVLRDNILKSSANKRIRIWSAACSSGMEPYSIALTLKTAIPDIKSWDARILATDIDTNVLQVGKNGEYPDEQRKYIPENSLAHISRDNGSGMICMPDYIKSLVTFKQLNLLDEWPMRGLFDAVFCRNVVIYFDKSTQKKLFARMAEIIKPGGWLYIGHSENLYKVCDRFELAGRTIYRKVG